MELGGNAPFIVLADADIEKAVDGATTAKMRNVGEACTAANRFFVHRSVTEEFSEKFSKKMSELKVRNGALAGTDVGPLIDRKGVEKVESLVADAVSKGARILTGESRSEGPGMDKVLRFSAELEVGMVGLNTGLVSNPAAPFGGVKQSGLGREGGKIGLDEFLEYKYTAMAV